MTSRRRPHRFLVAACLAGSALLHGWALVQAWEAVRPAAQTQPKRVATAAALRLAAVAPAGKADATRPPESPPAPAPLPQGNPARQPAAGPSAEAPASAPVATPANPAAGTDDWDSYLPRPLLTVPPRAQEPVLLAWPEFGAEQLHYEALLALYIDESGRVQAVRVQGQDLPAPLAEAARRAFEGRRFFPGELQGQAVKSRIFIEISFDQEPPPAPGDAHTPRSLSR